MANKEIRPIRVEGNIAYVPLTKGYSAIIDAEDAPLVCGRNWRALERFRPDGSLRTVYAQASAPRDGGPRKFVALHRVILALDGDMQGDHVDGDGLNNRRSNLRPATWAENMRNQRLSRKNTSGVKGVWWHKQRQKWAAQIAVDGHKRSLGLFVSLQEAAQRVADERAAAHGEFGRDA
jgi:hypothetical protein